jgi:hypothetical protein
MKRKVETRNVVAAEWMSPDGKAVRGTIVKRTQTTAMVAWDGARTERVSFGDPAIKFFTADEI